MATGIMGESNDEVASRAADSSKVSSQSFESQGVKLQLRSLLRRLLIIAFVAALGSSAFAALINHFEWEQIVEGFWRIAFTGAVPHIAAWFWQRHKLKTKTEIPQTESTVKG